MAKRKTKKTRKCRYCLQGMKDITGDGGYDFFGIYGPCEQCDGNGRVEIKPRKPKQKASRK